MGVTIMSESRTYLRAAGRDWFLPLYDPFVKLLGGVGALRTLLDHAALQQGQRVLDIGCGTGTLATMIKRRHPNVAVVGLDPDPKGLGRARRKAARAALSIQFDQGFGDELPYPEASFDRVFSSFMFHHLPADEKESTLRSVRRVLKPGGSLHMLDFEGPEEVTTGLLTRLHHSKHPLNDISESRVLSLMSQAGFANPKKIDRKRLLLGHAAYYRATT
jgi:ubiquinone/menaquinone biosynthesis C-methylase UbiE